MSEEVKDEQSETAEEKSLEEQIAALEDIASSFDENTEEKSEDEEVEKKSDEESEEAESGAGETEEAEAESTEEAVAESEEEAEAESTEEVEAEVEAETEEEGIGAKSDEENTDAKTEEKGEEPDHSEEECKDMENCKWHGVDAKEAEDSEEKAHPVATGYPYDRVEMQPGDPEFDEEEDEKNVMTEPKKRRIVVVEMDPSEVTEDMKAYEVEVDADEEEEYPEDEDAKRHEGRPHLVAVDDEERRPPMATPPMEAPPEKPAPDVPSANPRLARLLAMANAQNERRREESDEDEDARPLPKARLVGVKGEEEELVTPENNVMDPVALSKRLKRLGLTSDEIKSFKTDDYMCGIERTVRTGDVCNFCRGGCASEKGLPSLLEVELAAEAEYKGEVVDSGYAPKDDIFVLDLKTADDEYIEAYYAGNGSALGWIMLDGDLAIKSAEEQTVRVVSFQDAEQTALKNIKGKSLGVDVDVFQGEDAYVVEIDGADGKSYDAYVGVDGQFLGSDMLDFTEDEEAEIVALRKEKEALESELFLKRAYKSANTEEMAADGVAMADGSYPILTPEDLAHAIRVNHRIKSSELKSHIEKRAEHLECQNLIPAEWVEEKAVQTDAQAELEASLMELQMIEAGLPTDEKRVYTDETRQEYAERGIAMEDGSYPIRDVGDLKNAIQAFGRAKDPKATKKHIKKRAAALEATDLLPDNWE